MLEFMDAAKQQHTTLTKQFKDWNLRTQTKANKMIHHAQTTTQLTLEAAQAEFCQKLAEAEQTITTLRSASDSLKLEVHSAKEQAVNLERLQAHALEWISQLEV